MCCSVVCFPSSFPSSAFCLSSSVPKFYQRILAKLLSLFFVGGFRKQNSIAERCSASNCEGLEMLCFGFPAFVSCWT